VAGFRELRGTAPSIPLDASYVGVLGFLAPNVPVINQPKAVDTLWLVATRHRSSIGRVSLCTSPSRVQVFVCLTKQTQMLTSTRHFQTATTVLHTSTVANSFSRQQNSFFGDILCGLGPLLSNFHSISRWQHKTSSNARTVHTTSFYCSTGEYAVR